jgi:fructose-1,6-bisphosphatase/inositol monophosphatase family enzyme
MSEFDEAPPQADQPAPPDGDRWSRRRGAIALALVVAVAGQFVGFVIDGLRAVDAVGFVPPLRDKLRVATGGADTVAGILLLLAVFLVVFPELVSGAVGARRGVGGAALTGAAAVGAVLVVASAAGLYLQLVAPGALRASLVLVRLANLIVCAAATWTAFASLADSRLAPRLGRLAPKA